MATWRQRVFFLTWTLVLCVLATIIALMLPNTYRSEAVLAPLLERSEESAISKPLSALQGVAALVGFSPRSYTEIQEKVAYLQSRALIQRVLERNPDVMPGLFPKEWDLAEGRWKKSDPKKQPGLWDAFRHFDENYQVGMDKQTGLLHVWFQSRNPEFCKKLLEVVINEANGGLREDAVKQSRNFMGYLDEKSSETLVAEAQQLLLTMMASELRRSMLAECTEDFAFKVIDPPMVPDEHVKPRRSLLLIAWGFLAATSGSLLSLYRDQGLNPLKT
ncbi:MAG: hypothetical protein QGH30_09675 [Candidatus Krumholzibacteria bacterium]|nr:hypothetical protein [Candidatus Krumholzibacteria bacterium]